MGDGGGGGCSEFGGGCGRGRGGALKSRWGGVNSVGALKCGMRDGQQKRVAALQPSGDWIAWVYVVAIANASQQDEYSILNSRHSIGIHGYMLVYSVASKQSFEMVKIIRDKVLNHLVRSILS